MATVRARCVALIMSRRCAIQPQAQPVPGVPQVELWRALAPELWFAIARATPVTLAGEGFVECPFIEWVLAPRASFRDMHKEFVDMMRGVRAEDAWGEVSADLNLTPWDADLGLDRRNDDAFCLFGKGRFQARHTRGGLKELGCMRSGWPCDKAPRLHPDVDSGVGDDTHDLGFCTLDGLFAIDWAVCCVSPEHSGAHLRPKGRVEGSVAAVEAARLGMMLGMSWGGIPMIGPESRRRMEEERDEWEKKADATVEEYEYPGEEETLPMGSFQVAYPPKTRRAALGDEVYAQLMAFQQAILDAGVSPADFRMLVVFESPF